MRDKILEQLLTISNEMASNRELDSLLAYVVEQMLELFHAEYGYLVLLDAAGKLDFRVRQDNQGNEIADPETQISHTILGQVMENLQPSMIANAIENPNFQTQLSVRNLQIRSVMCVPLLAAGKVLGALYIENRTAGHVFDKENLAYLTMFAAQTAVAIDNAILNEELEERVVERMRELETLYQITAVAAQYSHLDTILQKSLDIIIEKLNLHGGLIILRLSEEQNHPLLIHTGLASETIELVSPPSLLEALVRFGGQQETLHIKDITQVTNLPLPIDIMDTWESWEILILPFYLYGEPVGVLGIVNVLDSYFDNQDITLLTSITKQIGISIENNQLHRQNEQLVVISERERLARDMHDSISQQLFGLKLVSENLKKKVEKGDLPSVSALADDLDLMVQQTVKEMRLLLNNLQVNKPLEEGLVRALQKRLSFIETYTNTQIEYTVDGDFQLPSEYQINLFLIAQEALGNAMKHARASQFRVVLTRDDVEIRLVIHDNGIGFDPQGNYDGMGLMTMQERAHRLGGVLTIESHLEQGTTVSVCVANGR